MAGHVLEPIKADSPEGRDLAARLSTVLAEIWTEIYARRAEAEIAAENTTAA